MIHSLSWNHCISWPMWVDARPLFSLVSFCCDFLLLWPVSCYSCPWTSHFSHLWLGSILIGLFVCGSQTRVYFCRHIHALNCTWKRVIRFLIILLRTLKIRKYLLGASLRTIAKGTCSDPRQLGFQIPNISDYAKIMLIVFCREPKVPMASMRRLGWIGDTKACVT
jgi:hypothetical protein